MPALWKTIKFQMSMRDLKKVSALECPLKGFLRNLSGTKFFVRLREVSALEDVRFREVPLYLYYHLFYFFLFYYLYHYYYSGLWIFLMSNCCTTLYHNFHSACISYWAKFLPHDLFLLIAFAESLFRFLIWSLRL